VLSFTRHLFALYFAEVHQGRSTSRVKVFFFLTFASTMVPSKAIGLTMLTFQQKRRISTTARSGSQGCSGAATDSSGLIMLLLAYLLARDQISAVSPLGLEEGDDVRAESQRNKILYRHEEDWVYIRAGKALLRRDS